MNILVADDEAQVRAGIVSIVHEVAPDARVVGQAASVAEVIALVGLQVPDLVLLDVRMPGGTGFDALRELGGEDPTQFPIWVVVTSYSSFEYARTAVKLNAFDYLLKPVAPEEMRTLLDAVRLEISHRISQGAQRGAGLPLQEPAAKARTLIERHFERSIGVTQVAEQIGVTPNYLSTVFRKKYGESPLHYLTRVRMERAAELLAHGHTVTEVSLMVGYYDSRHFSRLFVRHWGIRPSEYAREHRADASPWTEGDDVSSGGE